AQAPYRHPLPDAEDGRLADAARPAGRDRHRDQVVMKGIVGRKLGMTRIFDPETGAATPVTVIEAGPCPVVSVKTVESDGYEAYQVASEPVAEWMVTNAQAGHLQNAAAVRLHGLAVHFLGEVQFPPGGGVTVVAFVPGVKLTVA